MGRLFCVAGILALTLLAAPVLAQGQEKSVWKVLRVPHDYKSIQKAIDEADPGDTVFVDDGTYRESVILRDDIVLIGSAAERVILKGDRKKPVVTGAQGSEVRHITVENGHSGILCANVIMIIENCVVRGNRGTGIHCLISLPVIRNNIVFRNAESGIYCETVRSHRGYVANNMVAENGIGLMLAGQSEVLVENNVFYFNKRYGIFTAEGARKSRIVYNHLYGNRQPASSFTVIDRSNSQQDPGYTTVSADGFSFWDVSLDVLRGKGREGKDIGPQKRVFYKPRAD
jgi:nitrous oxidase accessory protein NosD